MYHETKSSDNDKAALLFEKHQVWAIKVAHSMRRSLPRSFDMNEIENAALVGLWLAIPRWDGMRPFRTFAGARVKGNVLDTFQAFLPLGCRRRRQQFKTECLPPDYSDPDSQSDLKSRISREAALSMLRPLGPLKRTIAALHWLEGVKQKDLATIYEMSDSRISQILSESREYLREIRAQNQGVMA